MKLIFHRFLSIYLIGMCLRLMMRVFLSTYIRFQKTPTNSLQEV
mgnify:CR=1 FL=1